jgi:hypothetical protein
VTEDDPVDDDLLTIGAFAARARLSPRALRLYDRLGLLAPAYVDDASGYRYYRTGQWLTQAGPRREVHFADWCAAGAEDPVCDVAFPVRAE